MEDINICEDIFGPDIYSLKGKTVRSNPKVVVNDYIEVPRELITTHQDVELCADIMYIQGVMFLVAISKNIKLISIVNIEKRLMSLLQEAFNKIFRTYNKARFYITKLHVYPEFAPLK